MHLLTLAVWPWRTSVGGPDVNMLYMPFLEHQLGVLSELEAAPLDLPAHLAHAEAAKKPARMASQLVHVPGLFRRIRMTYFDGGPSLQVFNSLWYPSFDRAAPLLGIDLLSFGKKLLCVVDAQPLVGADTHDHLKAVRDANPVLAGSVSQRWYEDNRYFSKQMLYSRFEERGVDDVRDVLLPAFQSYLQGYVDVVKSSQVDVKQIDEFKRHHADYDAFNADRDPAHRLFTSYFGPSFADEYVRDFLFALSNDQDALDAPQHIRYHESNHDVSGTSRSSDTSG